MNQDDAKAHLHLQLRKVRDALAWKLDGLSEYDVRRPMTMTGTNLLGLVKHNAISDSRYFGAVFDLPFPEALPRWDDPTTAGNDMWATREESRTDILGLYERVSAHTDATIDELDLDAAGYVPWWRADVTLFNVMVHRLSDATRHAGHADILREAIDGSVGVNPDDPSGHGQDAAYWHTRRETIELAARDAAGSSERG